MKCPCCGAIPKWGINIALSLSGSQLHGCNCNSTERKHSSSLLPIIGHRCYLSAYRSSLLTRDLVPSRSDPCKSVRHCFLSPTVFRVHSIVSSISSQKNVARLVVACFTAGGVQYRSDPAHLLFHWPFLEYEHWDVAHTRTYSCHHLSSSSARRGRERLSRCFAELQFSQGTHPTPVSRQASQKQRARQCIISSFLKLFFVCY